MSFEIVTSPKRGFVGVGTGLDLSTAAGVDQARAHATHYPVMYFPNQPLDDLALLNFAKALGPLEIMGSVVPKATKLAVVGGADADEAKRFLVDVSNLDEAGAILPPTDPRRKIYDGSYVWHTDCSYRSASPSFSILVSRIAPEQGGQTEFADMTAAFEALDANRRRELEQLRGLHSVIYSAGRTGFTEWTDEQRAALTPRAKPLVRTHPATGRKSLYLSSHLEKIEGWALTESRALIDELTAFATQPQFVYSHEWRVGDVVMWDNRCLMHRAMPFDSNLAPRRLRSVRVMDVSSKAAA